MESKFLNCKGEMKSCLNYLGAISDYEHAMELLAKEKERSKRLLEALEEISLGKKQEDIGLPPDSIAWRMMISARKAIAEYEGGK